MILQFLGLSFLIKGQPSSNIYSFQAKDINGNAVSLGQFKGKKLLIVNTASECGLTPQFKDLEALHQEYKDKGLVIIGFPSNNFGQQDPGSNSEIKTFCEKNYGVSFLMMEKIEVKGDSIHPIYKWLVSKKENGVMNSSVKWNFQKYLVDEQGFLVDVVSPWKKPDCKQILNWLNKS